MKIETRTIGKIIYDIVFPIMAVILVIIAIFGVVEDIIVQTKVIKQDNCVEIDDKYYCEVKEAK